MSSHQPKKSQASLKRIEELRKGLQKKKANQDSKNAVKEKEKQPVQNAGLDKDKIQSQPSGPPTKKILDSYRQTIKNRRLNSHSHHGSQSSIKQDKVEKEKTSVFESPFDQNLLLNNQSALSLSKPQLRLPEQPSKFNLIPGRKQIQKQQKIQPQLKKPQPNQAQATKQIQIKKDENKPEKQICQQAQQKQVVQQKQQKNKENGDYIAFQDKQMDMPKEPEIQMSKSSMNNELKQKALLQIIPQKVNQDKNISDNLEQEKEDKQDKQERQQKQEKQQKQENHHKMSGVHSETYEMGKIDGIDKNKQDKKAQKILLKQHLVIKQITRNMQQALRGIQYIQKKIKNDRVAKQRIKEALSLIAQTFKDQ